MTNTATTKLSPVVAQRQRIERSIAKAALTALVKAGYCIAVNNGSDDVTAPSQDIDGLMAAMFQTDEETLHIYTPGHDFAADARAGWINMVYGENGWDVICDYSTNLEPVLGPIFEAIENGDDGAVTSELFAGTELVTPTNSLKDRIDALSRADAKARGVEPDCGYLDYAAILAMMAHDGVIVACEPNRLTRCTYEVVLPNGEGSVLGYIDQGTFDRLMLNDVFDGREIKNMTRLLCDAQDGGRGIAKDLLCCPGCGPAFYLFSPVNSEACKHVVKIEYKYSTRPFNPDAE